MESLPHESETRHVTPPRRVLVVDDEEPIRRNFKAYLVDRGYDVAVAANAREACDVCRLEPPDLVLTDLRMPEMDGLELVRALRQAHPGTPVVIVSGAGDVREAIAAINEGAWDYVVKPVEHAGQLEVVMQRAFERARILEEVRQHRTNLEALVTERTNDLRERERTLRIVADNTYDWEWWRTDDGTFLYCSPSCARVTGYSREAFMADPDLHDRLVHPDDRRSVREHGGNRDASAPELLEFRMRHLDGTIRWIERICRPILADDGTALGRRGSNRDITDRKRLEAQILRMQRQECLGRMASGIAHDLNNILSPIMMAGDLLRDGSLTSQEQRFVELLRTSAVRGADLVKQLLIYGRGVEGPRTELDLREEVRSTARLVSETFPNHIEIRLELPAGASPIQADRTQLHQVILNLCVNARDAMPEHGTLTLAVEHVELDADARLSNPRAQPGVYAVLAVADTGTGMPAEVIDHAFDPFFTTKPLGEGSGLGLSTAQGIVAAHGGFIEVRSQPGEGSQFSVYFPVAPQVAERATVEVVPAPRAGSGQLVLVVDDEKIVGEMTQRLLQANGYNVLRADEGPQAIEIVRRKNGAVQVVLMDLCMPRVDGFATIQRLEELDPSVRVIAVSGMAQLREKALRTSPVVRGFVAKPWKKDQLLAALHDVLAASDRGGVA